MKSVTEAPLPSADFAATGSRVPFATDRRRWLQLALATIWIFDGILQSQSYMFTTAFSVDVLAGSAEGSPPLVANSVFWAATMVEGNAVVVNTVFVLLQLLIGLGIAWRRSVKAALIVSIAWSLIVWWFGETAGELFTGHASALAGAPGAALLYLVLAVLLWPAPPSMAGSFVASKPIGATAAKIVWIVLWGGLALLNLQPALLTAGAVRDLVAGGGDGQPGWLAAVIDAFTARSEHNGVQLAIVGAIVLALIAVGIFLPPAGIRAVVISALVVSAFIWIVGEALGTVFGGQSTDLNSGPLLALIALAYWPDNSAPDANSEAIS